jgi:serine/threonine protein kinase
MSTTPRSTSPQEYAQLQKLFEQAVAVEGSELSRFLDEVSREHPQYVDQLRSLLQHDTEDSTVVDDRTISFGGPAPVERHVEGYELLEELGRGGMGVVYKARQSNPDRLVALKMIRVGRFASEVDVQRFMVEVDAIAKLDHPNIVTIYEIGCHHGEHFFTMQLVEGSRFDEYLNGPGYRQQAAINILLQVCDAVAYCHDKGIVHRDLKPSNILLDGSGRPKLTDFGLAKHLEVDSNLTQTGELMGTPGYMAPELAGGEVHAVADPAADVYSLGAILYRVITGRPPIDAANVNLLGAIQRVRDNDIVAPRLINRWISRTLETVCMKCLRARPEDRYANAGELRDELRRYLEGEPIHAKPLSGIQQLLRWSRQQPGLAVTWLAIGVFYCYHLVYVYLLEGPGAGSWFHAVATAIAVTWSVGAYGFQKLLMKTRGSRWPLFCWTTMEVVLLSVLLYFGDGPRSPMVALYLVLTAASVLRFRATLVLYVTVVSLVSYLTHVIIGPRNAEVAPVEAPDVMPVALSIACIGVIQYFALRRSQSVIEMLRR